MNVKDSKAMINKRILALIGIGIFALSAFIMVSYSVIPNVVSYSNGSAALEFVILHNNKPCGTSPSCSEVCLGPKYQYCRELLWYFKNGSANTTFHLKPYSHVKYGIWNLCNSHLVKKGDVTLGGSGSLTKIVASLAA